MNAPRRTSTRVLGLVMWDNGAIVTLRMKDGVIERDRRGDPTVLAFHGRWTGEHADAVFAAVESALYAIS